jgi:hypothetical protein
MTNPNRQDPLYVYFRWALLGPCVGVTAALVALYFAGLPPHEVYLAGAGLTGGVALAEIASAFRERDQHAQVVNLNVQLQILKDRVAPVLGLPEPSLSETAYHLGELSTSLPLLYDEQPYPRVAVHLAFICGFCDNLGLHFSTEEKRVVWEHGADAFNPADAVQVIQHKAQSLREPLLPLFQLGNTTVLLRSQLAHLQQTRQILELLTKLQANLFIGLDPRYSQAVDALIDACKPYRDGIGGDKRESLGSSIAHALAGTPSLATDWIWAQDDGAPVPMRMVGPYVIAGREDGAEYEVTRLEGSPLKTPASPPRLLRWLAPRRARKLRAPEAEKTIITHAEGGWRCSAHPQANKTEPCWEVCLVLDATNGGQPVTKARVVPVRFEAADSGGS